MHIRCPNCHKVLEKYEKIYKCDNNHSFDIAKEDYVNLSLKNTQNTGDNQSMVKARREFLSKDYYKFLLDTVNELIDENDELIDLACGEGYYTSRLKANHKIGIDLSKPAIKYAAKIDKSTTYIISSIFNVPIESNSADKIITIFAPIAKEEIHRLLKEKGIFILVKPDVYHLYELKKQIYDNPYLNEVNDIEIDGLSLIKHLPISNKVVLDNTDLINLFSMTPYYNTTSIKDKEKINTLDKLEITFSFMIEIYQKY